MHEMKAAESSKAEQLCGLAWPRVWTFSAMYIPYSQARLCCVPIAGRCLIQLWGGMFAELSVASTPSD